MEDINPWTLGLGITGSVLGIMNTWLAINRDRVRVRVKPVHIVDGADRRKFGIEVLNLSGAKIYIVDVGFSPSRFLPDRFRRASYAQGMNGVRCLESRESFTFIFDRDVDLVCTDFHIRAAYARTSCGRTFIGTSPALKQLARETPIGKAPMSRTLNVGVHFKSDRNSQQI